MFTVTLLAAGDLGPNAVARAAALFADAGLDPGPPIWREPDVACEIAVARWRPEVEETLRAALPGVDLIARPRPSSPIRLLVADMDSTMITVECIDELADYAGLKSQVAAITERAMRGELPFAEALRARVALLDGVTLDQLEDCRRTRVRASPGAGELIGALAAREVECLLVSGGFTAFAEPVAAELGFHRVVANVLEVDGRRLTGRVVGDIVDGERKRAELIRARERLGLEPEQVLAIGDGANDAPMVRESGLGVAYRAKPVLAAAADGRLDHARLDALLHLVG